MRWCIALFFVFVFLSSKAYACDFSGPNQLGIIFKPESGINVTLLKEYCKPDSCTFTDSKMIFQSHYDSRVIIVVDKLKMQGLEVSTLGLLAPIKNAKFNALSFYVDLKDISNSKILDLIKNAPEKWDISDELGRRCAIGLLCSKDGICTNWEECYFSSDEKINERKSIGRTRVSFRTEAPLYKTKEEALIEIKGFLKKYDMEVLSDIYLGEDILEPPTYTVDVKDFNWSAALSSELQILLANGILYGITINDIKEIGKVVNTPNTFIYFKPNGCGNSFITIPNNSNESGWLLLEGNCRIDKYEDNCPKIKCYKCGPLSMSIFVPTLPLNLQTTSTLTVTTPEVSPSSEHSVQPLAPSLTATTPEVSPTPQIKSFEFFLTILAVVIISFLRRRRLK